MPLTKPALSEAGLENSLLDLFEEWLRTFFHPTNATTHAIGANAGVSFPAAELRFQQAALSQPLNGIGISLVWDGRSEVYLRWDTIAGARQQTAYGHTLLNFWVRAATASTASANARSQCQLAADRLFAILNNSSATLPLAQKGIHRLRPAPPRLVADTAFAVRLITCAAQLRWPVLSQINA